VHVPLRDQLLACCVAALWGVNFLAIHAGLEHFPPVFMAALRFAVIAVPTVLLVPRPTVAWRWLVGYGVGFGTLQFAFLFVAMDVGMPPGLASLVLQASAPFTVLLGALLLHERLGRRQAVGIAMAVLGLVVIAAHRAQAAALLPVVPTLLGALGWALGNLASRQARCDEPFRLVLWMSIVPPVPLFALSLVTEGPTAGWVATGEALRGQAWPAVVGFTYVVLLGTLLGSGLWTALMRRHPAGVVAPYSLLVPVVGMLAAGLVLDEVPHPVEVGAGAVIVLGVLLGGSRARRRPGAATSQVAVGASSS
jgi:O-acetylserine/cysteine efflux transporter